MTTSQEWRLRTSVLKTKKNATRHAKKMTRVATIGGVGVMSTLDKMRLIHVLRDDVTLISTVVIMVGSVGTEGLATHICSESMKGCENIAEATRDVELQGERNSMADL